MSNQSNKEIIDFTNQSVDQILTIVERSDIEDVKELCRIVSEMSAKKGKEAVLLLNVINPETATLRECIKIISNFKNSPICKRIGELFKENESLPEIDYSHEID